MLKHLDKDRILLFRKKQIQSTSEMSENEVKLKTEKWQRPWLLKSVDKSPLDIHCCKCKFQNQYFRVLKSREGVLKPYSFK